MITISWNGSCCRCKAPLDVHLTAIGYSNTQLLRTYVHMFKTLNFEKNVSFYKICGLRAKRVCSSCYFNIKRAKKLAYMNLKRYGNPAPRPNQLLSPSVTHEELKEWFDKLKEFGKRKDLDVYLIGGRLAYLYVCV